MKLGGKLVGIINKSLKRLGFNKFIYRYRLNKYIDSNNDIDFKKYSTLLMKYRNNSNSSCIYRYNFLAPTLDATIIVPTYNNDKFLKDCINSLLYQNTDYTYEVIVIDDGSTDNTKEILDLYKNEKLIVYHQENKGVSSARNLGLFHARGNFLFFVDSDDVLPNNAINSLLKKAIETNADIVEGNFQYIDEEGRKGRTIRHYKYNKMHTRGVPWGKCFKRELFSNVVFPLNYWFEDSIIHHIILPRAHKVLWINNIVYFYRKNVNGVTSQAKGNFQSIDSLWITMQLYEDHISLGLSIDIDYYEYLLKMVRLTFSRVDLLSIDIQIAIFYVFRSFFLSIKLFKENKKMNVDLKNIETLIISKSFECFHRYIKNT